jgi:YidC/Oxa1 family membrane protein insertase
VPLLAQFPVFISLYLVLKHFPHLPGDNLMWLGLVNITDKASVGWGPLLIAVYVVSQLASSYFMSATAERSQRIMLLVLPFAFIPFIINFKVGLVLYWMTTNLWTVGQGLITRRLMPSPAAPQRRSSRTPPKEVAPAAADAAVENDAAPAPAQPAESSEPRRVKRKKKQARR